MGGFLPMGGGGFGLEPMLEAIDEGRPSLRPAKTGLRGGREPGMGGAAPGGGGGALGGAGAARGGLGAEELRDADISGSDM